MPFTGVLGYDVRPVTHDGYVDEEAQVEGIGLDQAMETARLLSGSRDGAWLKYAKVRVCDTDTSWIMAEFAHGDRLHDHRSPRDEAMAAYEAMREAGFPVVGRPARPDRRRGGG